MILIVFFGLIAIVVIGLNVWDSHNINKIQEYYKNKQCEAVYYSQGQYQGICDKSIVVIKNGFTVDTRSPNELIFFKNIKELKKEDNKLIVIGNKGKIQLEFKNENDVNTFYKKVQNKYE